MRAQRRSAVEKADVTLYLVRQVVFLNNVRSIEQPPYKCIRYATKQGGKHETILSVCVEWTVSPFACDDQSKFLALA
ncbi:hypothetical protein LA66_02725 [Aureimonas altamirensis]|uniref:Uncharacterized protein n=1 Tax=Aureimonas altamirensis TaxID=370622 RepID=A0A0B1Q3Z7_9HYPH|nr:hypothetical protein LA66_02725 [Aureimonas altamirensis]